MNMEYSIGQMVSIIGIDIQEILNSYVKNISCYHIDFVIDTILTYNSKYLINLLFDTFEK